MGYAAKIARESGESFPEVKLSFSTTNKYDNVTHSNYLPILTLLLNYSSISNLRETP